MGNPAVRLGSGEPPAELANRNGVLNRIGGVFVAQASATLKPARDAAPDESLAVVTLEVPNLGLVRITFEVNTYRHGRSRHWHWRAKRADVVADA